MAFHTAANESRFHFQAGDASFLVTGFQAEESISELYRVELSLAAEKKIASDTVVGHTGRLTIDCDNGERFFHGVVREWRLAAGERGRFHLYEAVLVPQAALLEHRYDCRIFQHLDVPRIVARVFESAGITADVYDFRLQGRYPQRDYCVQYRESDLDFIRRLLAEEGIFFFFEHDRDRHRMIFGDSTVSYPPLPDGDQVPLNPGGGLVADQEAVITIQRGQQVTSGRYTQRDFNFKKPTLDLTTCYQDETYARLERYDYPGIYTLPEQGRRLVKVRLQQAAMERKQARGASVVARFAPGFTFRLTGAADDETYLLRSLIHRGEQPQVLAERGGHAKGTRYRNDFRALPADVLIRPTPMKKPTVQGIQTAIVTGPANEEIHTDRHGRVKVRFHWDRLGGADEHSSCWLRVSQGWAGAGWGALFIPRIGQEVVVDFLEGDPDRPLITGRAFHGENPPPYDLPAHKSVSTLKSLSTPGGGGFNEIRFEDHKDREQLFVHAQRDMDLEVNNDRRTFIGANAHTRVAKDLIEQVEGSHHLTVNADAVHQVNGAASQTTGRDRLEKIAGHYGLASGRQIHLKAGTELVIAAGSALTLKAGAGFLTIDSGGVALCGPRIKLNSGGSPGSGRGCFVQRPLLPRQAVSDLSDQTEIPPTPRTAAPHEAQAGAPAAASDHAAAQALPVFENLSAAFVHPKTVSGSGIDMSTRLKTGYEIDGPARMEEPTTPASAFSAIWNRSVPCGDYKLNLNAFSLDPETLKKQNRTETNG